MTDVVEVTLPYRPRNWAKTLHANKKRFAVLVLHRRAGKTTAILNHHVRAALDDEWERARLRHLLPGISEKRLRDLLKRRVYWHVMPTYRQGKLTGAWDMLKEIGAAVPDARMNNQELLLAIPSQTAGAANIVQIVGGDNPDALRGPGLSGLSLDEYSQLPPNIYGEVLSKALADHLGYAIWSGTIKGSDHLYRTYESAKADPEWFSLWQNVEQSLESEEGATIDAIRRAMEDERRQVVQGLVTQAEFDQEWYLSREAAIKGAFYGSELRRAREEGRIGAVPYMPDIPVDTDWDLGIDAMAVWFSQTERAGAVRVIDYAEEVGAGMPSMIKTVLAKPYVLGKHWAPHDIEQHEISSGLTRMQSAAKMGIRFQVTPKISVADGINAAQFLLSRCYFDEKKCHAGLEALTHYKRVYNKRLSQFSEDPEHDWASHGADAFRGLAVRYQAPRMKSRHGGQHPTQFMWG